MQRISRHVNWAMYLDHYLEEQIGSSVNVFTDLCPVQLQLEM